MRRAAVLPVLLFCCWVRVSECRESLRDQLAMLRREQWRDKERIEALERRVVVREERGSSPHALGDVLEEVRKEVEELTEELRGRQELEDVVHAMEVKVDQGLTALRQMAAEMGELKNEHKRIWRELTLIKEESDKRNNQIENEMTIAHDPFSEEGSGDLVSESFLPVDVVTKEVEETRSVPQNGHHSNSMWTEQKRYFQDLEQKVHEERSLLRQHLDEGQRRILQVESYCTQLVANASERFLEATSHVEDLEEKHSRTRRDVARLEFNVAQSQAALEVVANDRAADRTRIRDLKDEWNQAEIQLDQQRNRIMNLELVTTNLTLQKCRAESQVASRDLKLSNMELWLSQADRRLDESARKTEMTRRSDENTFRSFREVVVTLSKKVDNATHEIQQVAEQQAKMREDLEKMVRQLPKDCSRATESGAGLIEVSGLGPVEVYCDASTDGGPWLTFQRRFNGTENFFRNWTEYQKGFGNPSSELWLGNEILHRLTSGPSPAKLRIDLWDVVGRYLYAEYERFVVKPEEELYTLEVGLHKGNATDALRHHSGMAFSTLDRDNDASSTHCAVHYTGGWWYQHCHRADLNGRYALGMTWYDDYSRDWIQLEKVEMKIARSST